MEFAHILSGDAGLAGVRSLLLGTRAHGVLRNELGAMLGDPWQLSDLHLRRAKFKPGRKLTAYYDVELCDERGRLLRRRPIAVIWRDIGVRVLVSPMDEQYPHLAKLSDPSFVAEMVGAPRCSVTTIRYRPGQRHVLRYDIDRRGGARESVFAKLYRDEAGVRTFEVATRVADWLTATRDGGAAVRPLSRSYAWPAVFYPAVAGAPLSQRRGTFAGTPASELQRAGRLLRSLHGAPSTLAFPERPHRFGTELSAVARASEHVQVLLAGAAPRIAATLERARELNERLPQVRPTLVHGDFKLDHLWFGPDGLTLIDLDKCCLADPALDIGKLLADLHWSDLARGRKGPFDGQEDFLRGYGATPDSPLVRRARLYEAILLVKIAARRVPLFDRRWQPLTERLLDHAEGILEQDAARTHPRVFA